MPISQDIIESVRSGKCILFLGAMASAPSPDNSPYNYKITPPGGNKLSEKLAGECNYPYDDKTNIQRVSLYHQFKKSRHELISSIKREITTSENGIRYMPSPALHMLAALPFRVIITTNYDRLFDIALSRANTLNNIPKQPLLRVYNPDLDHKPEDVPLDPVEENPIYLKLHGDIEYPESIVITEEDYILFIQKMSDNNRHPIHSNIRGRINSWPTIFIGYSLKDYNLRLLFKTLRFNVDPANFPISFAVDPYPDELIVLVWQKGDKPQVNFVTDDLWNFVPELYKNIIGHEYQHE